MIKKIIAIFLAIFFLAQVLPAQAAVSNPLAVRLSGRIILAVQGNGGAWYVDPVNLKRYPITTPYNIFSLVGVGVSNEDLAKIPLAGSKDVGDKNFVARVKGKILLQVQGRGQAWYVNPLDGKKYALDSTANILSLIKKFGLGISNANLAKIISAVPAPAVKIPPAVVQPKVADIPYDLNYLEQKINDLVNVQRVSNGLPALIWNSDVAAVARAHSQELAAENQDLTSLNKICDYFLIHHESLTGGLYQDSRLASSGINYFSNSGENIAMQGGKQIYFYTASPDAAQVDVDACVPAVNAANDALKAQLESNISVQDKLNLIVTEIARRKLIMAAENPVTVSSVSYLSNDEISSDIVTGWMNSPGHRANILQSAFNEGGIGVAYVNGYIIATQDFIERVSCGYQGAPCCPSRSCFVPNVCSANNICQ